ncbi:hypothetical protein [Xanthomonas arboricola]|uniref:hypothetical protein n=1 Tax=Xanthomonas arboricola TaxID=56448 RepID=UPI00039C9298|nr:hypothetical protein [Xanthomonas arboricola]MDN0207953.1 hypothetical protein [Xanthomonas arboricola pv. corylina]MDN0212423.1 hypothetical protein [Xanthomonas arboricola pv. corylina]
MSINDPMKQLSDEIAAQVYRNQGGEFTRLLTFANLVGGSTPSAETSAAAEEPAGTIGIWKLDAEGTSFHRDTGNTGDWAYWAQQQRIEAKGARQRIVFLGESVARGMFYDPGYTPAQVLAEVLGKQAGRQAPEVIDLARTNASMATLRRTARQAEQLHPQQAVIFAGNNWAGNRAYVGREHTYALVASLRDGGIAGLRRQVEQELVGEITALMDDIAGLYAQRGVPVCWVLPEFNLQDWRDPKVQAHWLEGAGVNQAWLALQDQAEECLSVNDYDAARQHAEAMLALDGGDCATTAHLLAACCRGLGMVEEQRQFLEMARDASIIDFNRSYSPRITALIHRTIVEKAAALGHQTVDLQQVFHLATGTLVSGRELFLDYCHLTSHGIRLAMAAVARQLLAGQNGTQPSLEALLEHAPWPTDADEADAHLLAAIHNAHWGQSYDVVLHYCRRAAEKSPAILELMDIIVEIQNERLPTWMNARATELIESVSPQIKRYLFSMEFKCLDRLLVDAFIQCHKDLGVDLAPRVAALRIGAHCVSALGRVDLLDPYYHSTSFSDQQFIEGGVNQHNDYYKGYGPSSAFCFISGGEGDHAVRITLKSADGASDGHAEVLVNQVACHRIALSGEWQTHEITLHAGILKPGVNDISITWPTPRLDGAQELSRIGHAIRRSAGAEVHPVFGHIYAFEARHCAPSQQAVHAIA